MFGKSPRGATARPGPNEPARSALAIPHWLWLVFVGLFALSLAALLYLWQPWQPAKRPDAPVQVLAERLGRNPLASQRPSLTGKGLVDEIADVLAERRPFYEAAAHHTVDASRPLQSVCRHIADLWNAQAL